MARQVLTSLSSLIPHQIDVKDMWIHTNNNWFRDIPMEMTPPSGRRVEVKYKLVVVREILDENEVDENPLLEIMSKKEIELHFSQHFQDHIEGIGIKKLMTKKVLQESTTNFLKTFENLTLLYIDGSAALNDDFSSVGMVIPALNMNFGFSLPKLTSFQAESYALFFALLFIYTHTPRDYLILTDCQSVISHLHDISTLRVIKQPMLSCLQIMTQCIVAGTKVYINWVPGHSGIQGNVLSDHIAYDVRQMMSSASKLPLQQSLLPDEMIDTQAPPGSSTECHKHVQDEAPQSELNELTEQIQQIINSNQLNQLPIPLLAEANEKFSSVLRMKCMHLL